MEKEVHTQILERPKIILIKTEDQSALITIYIDIWKKTTENQRKNKRPGNVTNTKRQDISLRIVDQSKR